MRQPQKTRELDYRRRDNVEHEGYDVVHSDFHGELKNQNRVQVMNFMFIVINTLVWVRVTRH